MKKARLDLRKNLSEEEKNIIRKRMQGYYFCLNDAIKNGLEMYFYDFDSLKNRWGRFCEKIEIIKQ